MKKKRLTGYREYMEKHMRDPAFRRSLEQPDEDPYLEVAYRLLTLRDEKGWTQAQLGKKLGVSQQAVARLENPSYRGHSLKSLDRIAKACGMILKISFVPAASATGSS